MKDAVSESVATSKAKWQVELRKHAARGRKYLDVIWESMHRTPDVKKGIRAEVWGDGRIKAWLAPRLGLPPWLSLEVWSRYAEDRKAGEKPPTMPKAAPEVPGKVSGLGEPQKPATAKPDAASKGKHR